jgi:alanine racemase
VVFGRQGDGEISADELARLAGTINYEIVCAVSSRVPRHYTYQA